MQVNLSKESWHYRYYKFASDSEYVPSSLCPYFWGLVFLILAAPMILTIRALVKSQEKKILKEVEMSRAQFEEMSLEEWREHQKEQALAREKREQRRIFWGKALFWTVVVCASSALVWSLIIYAREMGWMKALMLMGLSLVAISIFALVMWLLIEKSGIIGERIKRTSLYNLIGGMISSAYERACPIINWKEAKNAHA